LWISKYQLRAFFSKITAERWNIDENPSNHCVIDNMIKTAKEQKQDPKEVSFALMNLWFSGFDVLGCSLRWCLFLLAKHEKEQGILRDEILKLWSNEKTEEENLKTIVSSLKYLSQIVRESLRLYPGYSIFGRSCQEDSSLGGYKIPSQTEIIVCPYVIHRNPKYWGEDANEFNPERWNKTDENLVPGTEGQDSKYYFPFGSGYRQCVSQHFAYPLLKTIVASIIKDCKLQVEKSFEPEIVFRGVICSNNKLPVLITKIGKK